MSKCVYCGKKIEEGKYKAKAITREFPVCSEECAGKTERYVAQDKKYKIVLYVIIFICAVGILLNVLANRGMQLIYAVQILAGLGFLLFPYPVSSFESFYSCSISKVKLISRIIGLFFILWGTFLLVNL